MLGFALAGGWLNACASQLAEANAPQAQSAANPIRVQPTPSQPIPLPTHPPTWTALPTWTAEPGATDLPAATPASTSTPTALSEHAAQALTEAQRERLASVALRFVAETEQEAIQVARSLGYLGNDGHPASVCGPLSAAILREAGLISSYTDLHDFWLLNPRHNLPVLERVFPPEEFWWYQTDQSIATFDFSAFPLKAGDFIYLFAGDPGSFEHMLVVSRVDEQGRAYAVTNINTPQGYVIQEVLLVDPHQPGVGQFAAWTERKNARLGLTGFGGFLLIRFAAPVRDKTPWEQWFCRQVDDLLAKYGGVWRILIKEVGGNVLYARDERHSLHPASVIKVPIAMLFFQSLHQRGVRDYETYLNQGIDGRSYRQLLRAMLVHSEEEATASLEKAIRDNRLDVPATLAEWGAKHTFVHVRQSTAQDMVKLLEGLYRGELLDPAARQIILEDLAAYTPGDDLRLGVIRQFLPAGYPFYNKRGTLTQPLLVVADAAIVGVPLSHGEGDYILAAFGYQGKERVSAARLEMALGELSRLFWQFTRGL